MTRLREIDEQLEHLDWLIQTRANGANVHLMNNIRLLVCAAKHELQYDIANGDYRTLVSRAFRILGESVTVFRRIIDDGVITDEERREWRGVVSDMQEILERIKRFPDEMAARP